MNCLSLLLHSEFPLGFNYIFYFNFSEEQQVWNKTGESISKRKNSYPINFQKILSTFSPILREQNSKQVPNESIAFKSLFRRKSIYGFGLSNQPFKCFFLYFELFVTMKNSFEKRKQFFDKIHILRK